MRVNILFRGGLTLRRVIISAAFCAAALLALFGCGGGFGTDSGNAAEIGPGIFEPDSARY